MSTSVNKSVLVIGNGGREHAICWKLAQSPQVALIYALPGSFGIAQVEKCKNLDGNVLNPKDFQAIATWCKTNKIDLVVVGPEDPLANGIGDVLKKTGIPCFGPDKKGAQIEADKKWSKDFMVRHNIPTAAYESFTEASKAKEFIKRTDKALVVKAAGLAAGKGVVVAANVKEACKAVDEILGNKKYGNAGETLVVEELLSGEEISLLAFVDGTSVQAMLPAQDHKRLLVNDEGPNTGGMGAYCPCPLIKQTDLDLVKREVLDKAVAGLRKEGIHYVGVLYAGLMLTPNGPKVLEFNCRFGDPETQVVLPLLKSDLYAVMEACCKGELANIHLEWRTGVSAVGVVMASAGYPETSTKGCVITGLPKQNSETQLVFHSGVAVDAHGAFLTNGGRVLIAIALDSELQQAAANATRICQDIRFSGANAQYRTDIAAKAYKLVAPTPTQTSLPRSTKSLSYKDSGVDIDAGDDLVQRIKPLSRGTQRPGVIGGLGGFGGLFRLNELSYKNPVICEAVNGVGSKIKLALEHEQYERIGYDLFAMCANDLLECGAEPVAFLDYIACGKLNVPIAAQIVKGIADGCRDGRTALVGGETAEMPSVYEVGKYDIAGYCVGVVEMDQELPHFERYEEGDLLIALPSSGLHCTGFNELLQGLKGQGVNLYAKSEFDVDESPLTLGQILGTPTRLYVKEILPLIQEGVVKSVAHITHGLLPDIARIIPKNYEIAIDFGDIKVPPLFGWLAAKLNLSAVAMLREHNCGIGMVLVIPHSYTSWKKALKGSKVLGVLKRRSSSNKVPKQSEQIEVRNFNDALAAVAKKFGGVGDYTPQDDVTDAHELATSLVVPTSQRTECIITQSGRRVTRVPKIYKDPVLIMGTDGVGTKIKIAQQTGRNGTVGVDLVAMCVNDILCNGAEPYTFASYYACGELSEQMAEEITAGVAEGAQQAGTTLIDAHIAEVPLLYDPAVYDLAGFSLGIAERSRILPQTDKIEIGDILIGLPSSGVHSNGFSLVHAVMRRAGVTFADKTPFSNKTFGEEFLVPTKIYVKALAPLIEKGRIKALAHITGGGLTENIPRVLANHLAVQLNAEDFEIPPVFGWLAAQGNIMPAEMQRTYNCGLGMILVVSPVFSKEVYAALKYAERATIVGQVVKRAPLDAPQVIVQNFESCLQRVQSNITKPLKRVAVLISGSGTNLQALIDATRDTAQGVHSEIVLVISNKPDVLGLKRAERAGIPSLVISHRDYKAREDFDAEMSKHLREARVDIICLAGFMRVLSAQFVREWRGHLVNIHPSLLPKHPGLHVQKKAIDAGDKESGCTVHFVDEGVDTGAIIVQASVPILGDDTEESLTARIQKAEHFAFPKALRLLANGNVRLSKEGKCLSV